MSLEALNHRFELVREKTTKYVIPFTRNVHNKKFSRGKKYIGGYLWLGVGWRVIDKWFEVPFEVMKMN